MITLWTRFREYCGIPRALIKDKKNILKSLDVHGQWSWLWRESMSKYFGTAYWFPSWLAKEIHHEGTYTRIILQQSKIKEVINMKDYFSRYIITGWTVWVSIRNARVQVHYKKSAYTWSYHIFATKMNMLFSLKLCVYIYIANSRYHPI